VAPPECDPRFIEVWTTAFQHPDRAVRRAGIRTGYSLRWPEMAELVRERIERDHHLRPMFEDLLAFFRPRSGIS
jgi:hypothetical protein